MSVCIATYSLHSGNTVFILSSDVCSEGKIGMRLRKKWAAAALCVCVLLSLFLSPAALAADTPTISKKTLPADWNNINNGGNIIDVDASMDASGQISFTFPQFGNVGQLACVIENGQPGDQTVVTFRIKNEVKNAGGEEQAIGPSLLTRQLLPLSTPNLLDKYIFRTYMNLIPAGGTDGDIFRDPAGKPLTIGQLEDAAFIAAHPGCSPADLSAFPSSDWMIHMQRFYPTKLLQFGDILYVHYVFEFTHQDVIAPKNPGGPIRDALDNEYMDLEIHVAWSFQDQRPVGYTVRYRDERGNAIGRPDRTVSGDDCGLFPGETLTYAYTASLDAVSGYTWIGYIPDPPAITLTNNVGNNIITLVYRQDTSTTSPPGRNPVGYIIRYQDENGASLRADRTVSAGSSGRYQGDTVTYTYTASSDAIDGYTHIGYIPDPPTITLGGSTSGNVIILVYRVVPEPSPTPPEVTDETDSPPPLEDVTDSGGPPLDPGGGSGTPDVPYTGGFNLADLFFVGLLMFAVGFLYLRGLKKKENKSRAVTN